MNLSEKQVGVLLTINRENEDKSLVDLDQIIERQSYETNKPSIQFIIRNLIQKKLIIKDGTEVRNNRRKVLFRTTTLGAMYSKWNAKPEDKTLKEVIVE